MSHGEVHPSGSIANAICSHQHDRYGCKSTQIHHLGGDDDVDGDDGGGEGDDGGGDGEPDGEGDVDGDADGVPGGGADVGDEEVGGVLAVGGEAACRLEGPGGGGVGVGVTAETEAGTNRCGSAPGGQSGRGVHHTKVATVF